MNNRSKQKSEKLNILILHKLGDPQKCRKHLYKLVFFLKNHGGNHNYIYHDVNLPLPEYIQSIGFHGIILDVTFFWLRLGDNFEKQKNLFKFIKHSDAYKIAFTQDDYYGCELVDDLLCFYEFDLLYSVIPNQVNVLYPRYSLQGKIALSYTGYIDEELLNWQLLKPYETRTTDVGYRTTKLLPYCGWVGELKWRIADLFLKKALPNNLKCDISYQRKDIILGKNWYDFINNCKFTLGSLSGSSLLDPGCEIYKKVNLYCSQHSNYSFLEVERRFFPGLDGKYLFTAISPRNIEAGLLKSCQILVKGNYSNILQPWEHYLPLNPDCSNFDEILEAMKDSQYVKKIIANCHQIFLDKKELHFFYMAQKIIQQITEGSAKKKVNATKSKGIELLIARYNNEMIPKYKILWKKLNLIVFFQQKFGKIPIVFNILKLIYIKSGIRSLFYG